MNTINAGAFNLNLRQVSSTQSNQNHSTKKTVEEHDAGTQKFKKAIESILQQQGMKKTDKTNDEELTEAIIEELSQLLNLSTEELMQFDELNFKKMKGGKETDLLSLLTTHSEDGKQTLNIIFGDVKSSKKGFETIAAIAFKDNTVKSQESTQQLNTIVDELKKIKGSINNQQLKSSDLATKLSKNKLVTIDQAAQKITIETPDDLKIDGQMVEKNFKNMFKSIKKSTNTTNKTQSTESTVPFEQMDTTQQNKSKNQRDTINTVKATEDNATETEKSTKKVTEVTLDNQKVNQQTDDTMVNIKKTTTQAKTTQQRSTTFETLVKNNNVMKQINEKVEIKTLANKNEIEIKLKPDALGKMKITLSSESSKMAAKILVENTTVQQYLENNLTELKTTLAAKGITVDQLNVETDNRSSNDQYNKNSNQGFNQFDQEQRQSNNRNRQLYYQQFTNNKMIDGELEINEMNPWQANDYYSRGFEYFA